MIRPGLSGRSCGARHGHIDLDGRDGDTLLDTFVFAGDDRMVRDVWSAGRHMVRDGRHVARDAIASAYRDRAPRPEGRAVTVPAIRSWQAVRDEVHRRIRTRLWRPGDFIPHEADLAREFGCARATVNRALRDLADEGLLDRRRKAGTRVAVNPVRRATLDIPVIRDEIEARGHACRHAILSRETAEPPPGVRARMGGTPGTLFLHIRTLYTADGAPYVFEDRWINPAAVPAVNRESFAEISPNEWLVREVPFEGGDFAFSAITSSATEAAALSCNVGVGLFVLDRVTWSGETAITSVRLVFHPGYRMQTRI